eukprot:3938578-Rhodomonas_salina.1
MTETKDNFEREFTDITNELNVAELAKQLDLKRPLTTLASQMVAGCSILVKYHITVKECLTPITLNQNIDKRKEITEYFQNQQQMLYNLFDQVADFDEFLSPDYRATDDSFEKLRESLYPDSEYDLLSDP